MTYASEVLADSPLLYWRLGESSGTTAADASGNGRTGTYNGSPTLGTTGLLTGDSDTAVTFNGSTQFVQYADTANLNGFAVEAWIKGTATGERHIVSRYDTTTANQIFLLYQNSSNRAAAIVRTGVGAAIFAASTGTINDGSRHHLVLVYDPNLGSNQAKLYVDGAVVAQTNQTGTPTTNDVIFQVASSPLGGSGARYSGVIDEVAYYAAALSSTRISAHYTAGTTIPPITIHPDKITSTSAVRAPAIVPYVPPPADGNVNITAELAPARLDAVATQPNRSAQIADARHTAGVNAT